jgi:hypothetical protein
MSSELQWNTGSPRISLEPMKNLKGVNTSSLSKFLMLEGIQISTYNTNPRVRFIISSDIISGLFLKGI